MMIDRRTFILATTPLVAATSALLMFPSLLPGSVSSPLVASETNINRVVFKINGWDSRDDSGSRGSKTSLTGPVRGDSNSDEVVISINQAWRTAWR
jgi:hypothetical protein